MSTDELLAAADALPPADKWQLVTKLWARLPPEAWPAPSDEDLAICRERSAELDAGLVEPIPGEVVKKWLRERIQSYG
jgi:putative addiction module component (TIGR02574 family)